jgi:flagellar assembly protein FliH
MTARTRFLFDADFGPAKEAPPKVTPEQHQAAITSAEQRGYQRGLAAAEAQARTEAQRRTATAHERIAGALQKLAGGMAAIEGRLETDAVEVAVAVGGRLAGALLAEEPIAEIAALATDCFKTLLAAPHVAVRVNDGLYEEARRRLEEIARAAGFEGRLVVLGEREIAAGDCRVEWADGGAIRERKAIEAAIDDLVARFLAARVPH